MTREFTKREKGLLDMKSAMLNAARILDRDWPQSMLDDPMVTGDRHTICKAYRYDMARLRQAGNIIDTILLNAEGFASLFELAQRMPKEFQAIVVLAQVELQRPAREQAA